MGESVVGHIANGRRCLIRRSDRTFGRQRFALPVGRSVADCDYGDECKDNQRHARGDQAKEESRPSFTKICDKPQQLVAPSAQQLPCSPHPPGLDILRVGRRHG